MVLQTLLLTTWLLFTKPVYADYTVILAPSSQNDPIQWDTGSDQQRSILVKQVNGNNWATLKGSVKKGKNKKLILEPDQSISLDEDGRFTIDVLLTSEKQSINILLIDEWGKVEKSDHFLYFPEWEKREKPRLSLSPGLGLTWVDYQQSGQSPYSALNITFKGSAEYFLNSRWSLGGNLFLTALPFLTHPASVTLRFLGVNARVGYQIPSFLPPTWTLKIMFGFYYNTCLSSLDTFGYQNAQGPQLFPVLSKNFSSNKSAWIYVKYSPLFTGKRFVSLSNNEFSIGGGYKFLVEKIKKEIAITLDIANLSLLFQDGTLHATTYSIGAQYYF